MKRAAGKMLASQQPHSASDFGIALAAGLALALGSLALAACEQPFRAGLGPAVDLQLPGVDLASPSGGAFIRGRASFSGEGWDDLNVRAVQIAITSHPGFWDSRLAELSELADGEIRELPDDELPELPPEFWAARGWIDVDELAASQRSGGRVARHWRHSIYTEGFRDGELRLRLRVSDGAARHGGEWVVTEEIAFRIRNNPPAITMTLPQIMEYDPPEVSGSGRLGGPGFNFGFGMSGFARTVDGSVGSITGMIRDERGVDISAGAAEFRLWEVVEPSGAPPEPLLLGIPQFPPGVVPPAGAGPGQAPWRSFEVGGEHALLVPTGATTAQFFYIFDYEAQGRFFAFEIRARSMSARVDGKYHHGQFHYPRDAWSPHWWATYGYEADGATLTQAGIENSFAMFRLTLPEAPPRVALIERRDIFSPSLSAELPIFENYESDIPHPYLTSLAFNAKSGAFTLRVMAAHDSGILEAMALWEGAGRRGRFVWDPAVSPSPPSGWDAGNNVSVARPFTEWGRRDPNQTPPAPLMRDTHRNFVFTYGGGVPGRLPAEWNGAVVEGSVPPEHRVGGRYRIQFFDGPIVGPGGWEELLAQLDSPAGFLQMRASPHWRDDEWAANEVEGIFTIRVYARTPMGTVNAAPLTASLTLDRRPPAIELTNLEGGAGLSPGGSAVLNGRAFDVPPGAQIVNGVIRPRFFAAEGRAVDSSFRVSGGYFSRPGSDGAEQEVMFALVHDDYESAMSALPKNFWPLPRAADCNCALDGATGGAIGDRRCAPEFPGVASVARHGPIHDGIAYMQTSRSHGAQSPDALLGDGLYWLHVFARDQAFNVGHARFPLVVQAESDRPALDFSIGLVEPVVSDPNTPDGQPGGFVGPDGAVRAKMRPTTDIRFRVRDYDSLDLGVGSGGAPSSMRVYFVGSYVDGSGVIRALGDEYAIKLHELPANDPAHVKNIFRPRNPGSDSPLREREGTILQSDLLRLLAASEHYQRLHGGGDAAAGLAFLEGLNSLPDGMYRAVIYLYDDERFKLAMPGESAEPAFARAEFWVAVDNRPPTVDWDSISPRDESFRPRVTPTDITGFVWDDNGPISLRSFSFTRTPPGGGSQAPGPRVYIYNSQMSPPERFPPPEVPAGSPPRGWVELIRDTGRADTWRYTFDARFEPLAHFPSYLDGIFDFRLVLEDRFGNSVEINRQHRMDLVPPAVNLTRPIETFSRPSIAASRGISQASADRLANMVVSFTVSAHDNFTVEGIRWWLLPAGRGAFAGAVDSAPGGLNDSGEVSGFDSFPARSPGALDIAPGRAFAIMESGNAVGAFGRISAPGGTVHIDTYNLAAPGQGLPDGEYVLHIVARDVWGNNSHRNVVIENGSVAVDEYIGALDWMFLLQQEDEPYFSGVRPGHRYENGYVARDVLGRHALFVGGIVMEDDGFGMGMQPDAGSVEIWIGRERPSLPLADSAFRPVPNESLTLSGREITLNIDLLALSDAHFGGVIDGDGNYYYVLRARDSADSKSQIPYAQPSRSRYRLFSFVLDSEAPEMEVDMFASEGAAGEFLDYIEGGPGAPPGPPEGARTFRDNFFVAGHVTDVSLARRLGSDGAYWPYIRWTLTGALERSGDVALKGFAPEPYGGGLERSLFAISADDIFSSPGDPGDLGGFAGLIDGNYTLELLVVDMIGMPSLVMLSFTVDTSAPVTSANFPSAAATMTEAEHGLWHGAWTNEQRRVWAAESDLPVIFRDVGLLPPVLSGSIVDEFSCVLRDGVEFRLNGSLIPSGSLWTTAPGRSQRWEIPLELPAGAHTLSIGNVGDGADNRAEAPTIFAFRIETSAPALALDAQNRDWRVLGYHSLDDFAPGDIVFSVSGAASGANLRGVRLRFREAAPGGEIAREAVVSEGIWNWSPGAATLTWSYGFRVGDFRDGFEAGRSYEIEAVALNWGSSGLQSEPDTSWIFAKDVDSPAFEFAAGLGYARDSAGPALGPADLFEGSEAWNQFVGQNLVIQGTVTDAHSDIRPGSVARLIERWDWAANGWVEERGWEAIPADRLSGSSESVIWRTENLGLGAPGGGGLSPGLYRLRARAMDASWFAGGAAGFDLAGGIGNPAESPWLYFYYDPHAVALGFDRDPPPAMSSLAGAGTGLANGAGFLGFQVEAASAVGIRSLGAELRSADGAGAVAGAFAELPVFGLGMRGAPPGGAAGSRVFEDGGRTYELAYFAGQGWLVRARDGGAPNPWRYVGRWVAENVFALFVPVPDGAAQERYAVAVAAQGLSGATLRSREIVRNVELDNTAPSGGFSSPERGAYIGGFAHSVPHLGSAPAAISGEAFDRLPADGSVESGVARVDFRFGLLDGEFPTEEALAGLFGRSADPADNAPLAGWARLEEGASGLPAGFSVFRPILFSWQISAGANALLDLARTADASGALTMALRSGSYLDLPMWARVVDGAGNVGYFHQIIRVNEEADRPLNAIHDPASDSGADSPRGGAISFRGVAQIGNADVNVGSVLYRVWVGGAPAGGAPSGGNSGGRFLGAADMPLAVRAGQLDLDVLNRALDSGEPAHPSLIGGDWFAAAVDVGFVAPWAFTLNSDGRITALIDRYGFDYGGAGAGGKMRVTVEVVAINAGADNDRRLVSIAQAPGSSVEDPHPNRREFYLTSSAPRIIGARVDRGGAAATEGATPADPGAVNSVQALSNPHMGTFTIRATLDAGSDGGAISAIRIVRPHEIPDPSMPDADPARLAHANMDVWGAHGAIARAGVSVAQRPGSPRLIDLVYSLNPAMPDGAPPPGPGAGEDWVRFNRWRFEGGAYYVEIRVYDDVVPPSVATVTLPIVIDNFAPVADPALHSNPLQAGTGAVFQGRVLDGAFGAYGARSGGSGAMIDRVYAWFERGGEAIPAGISRIGHAIPGFPALRGRAAGFSGAGDGARSEIEIVSHGSPGSVDIPAVAMEISGRTWGAQGAADGQIWVDSHAERVVQWQFVSDTTAISDGPVTLVYVVVDTAGNASLHEQRVVVRNNTPEIARVILHTSATGLPPTPDEIMSMDPGTSAPLPIGRSGVIEVADFAARNMWLGFTVEAIRGNPRLRYRVQHVSRDYAALTVGNVREMIERRRSAGSTLADSAGDVANMYTVRSHGTVPPDIWRALGVLAPIGDNSGAHFVFLPSCLTELWEGAACECAGPSAENDGLADLPISVWRYSIKNEARFDGAAASDGIEAARPGDGLAFDAGSFGGAGGIQDGRNYFLIRVWDSAVGEPGYVGYPPRELNVNDQLHDALVVAMEARLIDRHGPTAHLWDLNPGFITGGSTGNLTAEDRAATVMAALRPLEMEGNRARGGLFNVGPRGAAARSGHIEPRSDSPAGGFTGAAASGNRFFDGSAIERDLASGRVILRGRAHDNERVQSVQLAITGGDPGEGDWFDILRWNAGAAAMEAPAGLEASVGFAESYSWRDGHSVEWAFLWDTEAFAGGEPAQGARVSARALDWDNSIAVPAPRASAEAGNDVDIVPYVSGFQRQPRYAAIRSMQGWHSFYQGETGIAALGWNLGGTPGIAGAGEMGGAGIALAGLRSEDLDALGADRADPLSGLHIGGRHRIAFEVPAASAGAPGLHSGRINFVVAPSGGGGGGSPAPIHNHRSRAGQPWNRDNIQGSRSALWTNRPYAHIWRSADALDGSGNAETGGAAEGAHIPRVFMGPFDNTAGLEHPGMALEYSGAGASLGRLHGAWGVFGTAMIHYGTNQRGVVGDPAPAGAVSLAATRLATASDIDPFVLPDIGMFEGSGLPNVAFVHMHDNTSSVRMRANLGAQAGDIGTGAGAFPLLTETGGGPRRWQNVRVAKAAANDSANHPGRLHVSAYDALNRSLPFATRGPGGSGAGAQTAVVIDGPNATLVGAGLANSGDAGLFSAVGHDAHGPIVAYYDFANDTVRIAWGRGDSPGNADWTRREVLSGALRGGSGTYVSMAVDASGAVHLAFFNSRLGALVYARAPARAGSGDAPAFQASVVDSLEGAGTWTSISVDHWGNPWIAYGYQGRQGNFDGIRMAFRSRNAAGQGNSGAHFVAGNGWEAVQMPAPFRASYDRLSIQAWPPSNRADPAAAALQMAQAHRELGSAGGRAWGAAIGYASGSGDRRFRIGYFFWPEGIGPVWPPAPGPAAPLQ